MRDLSEKLVENAGKRDNLPVDFLVVVLALLIIVPVAVVWALSKSAGLRGPMPPARASRPVEALVTEVVPEEHPEQEGPEGAQPPSEQIAARPFRRPAAPRSERSDDDAV
jgi:hypothetical protein